MPIINTQDAQELDGHLQRFYDANPAERPHRLRQLFTEKFDFNPASGKVSLAKAPQSVTLPSDADRIASAEGVNILYVPLQIPGTTRVRKAEAVAVAKLVANQLGDDMLLLMTNEQAAGQVSQLHVILPTFMGSTPALRRMVIERDLPRRTALQQLSNIYHHWQQKGDLRLALEDAFNVEAVTKAFFKQYQDVFERVQGLVRGFPRTDDGSEAKKLFVQTLFNRVMFIYFLSRKGWLKFKGDPDYLATLWKDYRNDKDAKNFYENRLEVLFFAGLNNEASRDVRSTTLASLIGEVPFLNGGLFDKTTDEIKWSDVAVPDEAIDLILHELFDRYNFTVTESTPLDQEVAVDPEMLGKVFEELVTGRHETGSYYTPRPVVSFMCREALKGYLQGAVASLSVEAIERFVDQHDVSGLNLASAEAIRKALEQVKVVDPACGSGAYLLGMMHELVELETALYSEKLLMDTKSLYDLKLRIIEENVYGADIDQFAVNIAMLRLWLSLAIDYESFPPPPLPNLDFKIVCGDSLLGPDPNPDNYGTLFRHRVHDIASQLADLKGRHMKSTSQEKANLTRDIESLQGELRKALTDAAAPEEAVDWRVEFAEVFDAKGGFDVAIANPPYVTRTSSRFSIAKPQLRALYANAVTGMSDLYCYFYARGLQLLRSGGQHIFVCSNTWLDVGFGSRLQEYLLNNSHIRAIYESQVEKQFSTAEINTLISVISKGPPGSSSVTEFVSLRDTFDRAITDPTRRRTIPVTIEELWASGSEAHGATGPKRYVGERWGGRYLRAPDIFHKVMGNPKLVPVTQYARARLGVTTGANEFFFVEREGTDSYSSHVTGDYQRISLPDKWTRPVVRSVRDCENITVRAGETCWHVVTLPGDVQDSEARAYIRLAEEVGIHERPFFRGKKVWYSLGSLPDDIIAVPELVYTRYFFLWNGDNMVLNKNFYGYRPNGTSLGLLWAALNSTLTFLQFELSSRKPGAGASGISVNVANRIAVLSLSSLRDHEKVELQQAGQRLLEMPILDFNDDVLRPERMEIDELVFHHLGFGRPEIEAVYESYLQLIEARVAKARGDQ